jgi:hypothetical protein
MEITVTPHPGLGEAIRKWEADLCADLTAGELEDEHYYMKDALPLWVATADSVEVPFHPGIGGSRCQHVDKVRDIIILVDPPTQRPQAPVEAKVWESIEPDDRQHFAEFLGYGEASDGTPWAVKRFYHGLYEPPDSYWQPNWVKAGRPQKYPIPRHTEQVVDLFIKYGLESDYGVHQWKYTPDGGFIIHDYGISKRFRDEPVDSGYDL